ncbi:MAG: F420-0--gamma-glutamyl ligase [Parcubacteria group bacterium GW2011_GWA2_38_13b]|nr:MAG: F420-0--gamma-glutamyl ligase [Parcubacteria group bacterium GW2011_GWA2_38_13b]
MNIFALNDLEPNFGKNLIIELDNYQYARFPIKTHIITKNDGILDVCQKYAKPHLRNGDFLFISERIIAIMQGRAYPIRDIKPSRLAKFLVKFVHKSPYGIGLGSPWTMELAIREAGRLRIILGAFFAAVAKLFGIKGFFYKFVGKNINAIDGPCSYTLAPYNEYAKLGPANPAKVAGEIRDAIGNDVVIIDANDLGVAVLGKSREDIPDEFCKKVFSDNPLGQSSEQTPLCIVRKM